MMTERRPRNPHLFHITISPLRSLAYIVLLPFGWGEEDSTQNPHSGVSGVRVSPFSPIVNLKGLSV